MAMHGLARVTFLALLATGVAAQDLPLLSRDNDGNLHVTTEPGSTLYVNGVAVNTTALGRQADMEARLARLEAAITTTADGVTIVGGSKGAFLSRGQQFVVEEGASAWEPAELTVQVGDTVTWQWSGLDAVYEVAAADSATARAGGFSSGDPALGGAFPVRFTFPGTHYLRSASKGYVTTVTVGGVGNGGDVSRDLPTGMCRLRFQSTFDASQGSNTLYQGTIRCVSSMGRASCPTASFTLPWKFCIDGCSFSSTIKRANQMLIDMERFLTSACECPEGSTLSPVFYMSVTDSSIRPSFSQPDITHGDAFCLSA